VAILAIVTNSCSCSKTPPRNSIPAESAEPADAITPYPPVAEAPVAEEPEPVTPSVVPITPVPVPTPEPTPEPAPAVSVQDLILDLGDSNGSVAREAAVQLTSCDSVEELVTAFANGDAVIKQRVVWCLKQMNEPVRIFFAKVRSAPYNWHPRVRVAVEEITVAVASNFYQETPVNAGAEKNHQLLSFLSESRKEVSLMRFEMKEAARKAKVATYYGRVQWARYCIALKTEIERRERIIKNLSAEIES